ncbi:hypothetical protein CALVIDRAFT_500939 [Calocera viscosa TUFC12733]|uniref:PCI domain-containing protein n=1 Tax=Calocera viscosa (strain TUFC12733) TaxID=1330018 RepID=A0A167KPS5_CALVF|nr:hypothetical protein CALVIDRAFT_500939 [Calocera viscosa TUFC12733]
MKFPTYLAQLASAVAEQDAGTLIGLLQVESPWSKELLRDVTNPFRHALQGFKGLCEPPWDEIAITHLQVVSKATSREFGVAYKEQAKMIVDLLKWFQTQTSWFLPVLYRVLDDLRDLAGRADEDVMEHGGPSKQADSLEDAARIIGTCFSACMTDRAHAVGVSRKWGIYYIAGLAMKCYFRISKTFLSKNIIRAIEANSDTIPPLESYPRSHQVTWRYYIALLDFLGENYDKAERGFVSTFYGCPFSAVRNKELALNYLIPIRLLKGILPSRKLLSRFPNLETIYGPFTEAIRRGDIKEFDARLAWAEVRLVEAGVYLTVERAREVCLSRMFRKTWLTLSGPEPLVRVPISSFRVALKISGLDISQEEVECLLANMIYKGYMRGYLSHGSGLLVLSKLDPFPSLLTRQDPAPL